MPNSLQQQLFCFFVILCLCFTIDNSPVHLVVKNKITGKKRRYLSSATFSSASLKNCVQLSNISGMPTFSFSHCSSKMLLKHNHTIEKMTVILKQYTLASNPIRDTQLIHNPGLPSPGHNDVGLLPAHKSYINVNKCETRKAKQVRELYFAIIMLE